MNKTPIIYTTSVFVLMALLFAGIYISKNSSIISIGANQLEISPEQTLKVDKEDVLDSREIDWIEKKQDGTVENHGKITQYAYVSDVEVPQANGEDISEKKTNVRIFPLEDNKVMGVFNSAEAYYWKGEVRYETGVATTSIEALKEQTKPDLISRIKNLFTAEATETTFFANAGGDGTVEKAVNPGTWADAHDAETGGWTYDTHAAGYVGSDKITATRFAVSRSFHPFLTGDTITAGAVVSTSTFYATTDDDTATGDRDEITIVEMTSAEETDLTVEDLNQAGATDNPTEITDTRVFPSTGIGVTYGFSLNDYTVIKANGEASSCGNATGYTCIGMRSADDADDTEPTQRSNLEFRMTEYTGTASDPTLVVVWALAPPEPDSGSQDVIWFE